MQLLEQKSPQPNQVQDWRVEYFAASDEIPKRRQRRCTLWERYILLVLVTAYCTWVFSLPLFPTQDGAVHLYYARILAHLLSGSPLYSQYFAIRYPVPPYALHYALLLGLAKFMRPLLAEKTVVCLTIVSFVYGFRAFARNLGDSAGVATLWVVPLSLNWMLGMGFHNFCLSMAFGLWAIAAWLRAVRTRSRYSWAAYCVLLLLMLFTHPVPLAITVAFVIAEPLLRLTQQSLTATKHWRSVLQMHRRTTADMWVAICSLIPLLYVVLFVKKGVSPNVYVHHMGLKTLLSLAGLKTLSVIGKTPAGYVYRLSYYVILLIAVRVSACGLRRRWSEGALRVSDLILLGSLVLGLVIPVLPRTLNGSDYFADRLIIYVWIGALAATACYVISDVRMRWTASAAAVIFSIAALILTDHYVRPVAQRVAGLEAVRSEAPGLCGIFVDAPATLKTSLVSFDPYLWSAARYFRQTDTIMLNGPWLDLPIIPIEARGEEQLSGLSYQRDYPDVFRDLLLDSRDIRDRVASASEFVLETPYSSSPGDPALVRKWPQNLSCEQVNGFQLCAKSRSPRLSFGS